MIYKFWWNNLIILNLIFLLAVKIMKCNEVDESASSENLIRLAIVFDFEKNKAA
jgi:hypothetical protein